MSMFRKLIDKLCGREEVLRMYYIAKTKSVRIDTWDGGKTNFSSVDDVAKYFRFITSRR